MFELRKQLWRYLHWKDYQQDENKTDCWKPLSIDEAVEELTYSLLQGGEGVRK